MKKIIKRKLLYLIVVLSSIGFTIVWVHNNVLGSFVTLNLLYTIAAIRAIKDYLQ